MTTFGVIEGGFRQRSPDDMALQLRQLADAVDRGEVTELIATYVQNDGYMSLIGCGNESAVAMSSLQWSNAVNALRES